MNPIVFPARFFALLVLASLPASGAATGGFSLGTNPRYAVEDGPVAYLSVNRSGDNLPAATVELVSADGIAKAGVDYVAVQTNLTFAAGQTYQQVTIPLLNDALIEGDETFVVRLRNPVGFPLDTANTSQTVHIQDNDRGFVLRWNVPNHGGGAENESAALFEVAIVGDFTLAKEAAVIVSTEDGTATAGVDYQATAARLVFAPGERVKSFTVPILNDALAEGDETFFVGLSQPVGAPISYFAEESKVSRAIFDNELGYRLGEGDLPGVGEDPFVFREGTTATVTVRRDGDFDITSTVKLSLATSSDAFIEVGTATAGVDFPATNLLVTFGPGETRKTVTFDLPDDGVNEAEDLFFITLEAVNGSVPIQQPAARAYVLDSAVLPALVARTLTWSRSRWKGAMIPT